MSRNLVVGTLAVLVGIAAWPVAAGLAAPLGTAFTYQGQLKDGGSPASGTYDLQFKLFDAASLGTQQGSTIQLDNVVVTDGLFTVSLDFGAEFTGDARWVEIGVHSGAEPVTNPYTILSPRQALTPAPYAIGLRLPFSQGVDFTDLFGGPAFRVEHSGNGYAGAFVTSDATNTKPALYASVATNNEEPALEVHGPLTSASPGTAGNNKGTLRITTGLLPSSTAGLFLDADGIDSNSNIHLQGNTNDDVIMVEGGGNVGIGGVPTARLEVYGGTTAAPVVQVSGGSGTGPRLRIAGTNDASLTSDGLLLLGSSTSANVIIDNNEIMARSNGATATLAFNANGGNVNLIQSGTGNVGIGTSSPAAKLHVNGTARVDVLEIVGADVAEKFPVSDKPESGMVMEIDPEHAGKLRVARGAYNRRVAGVVSGAGDIPIGVVLGNLPGHEDAPAIALSGRVWVRCDTGAHAIEIGDLLTTCASPGHAMKVIDHGRAVGAVIGKAMTGLPYGQRGLVLVLVSLQ